MKLSFAQDRVLAVMAHPDDAELLCAGTLSRGKSDGVHQRQKLIEVYRQFNPTLVLAHAANDYHPDHRAASAVAEAASWFCASRGHVTWRVAATRTSPRWKS